MVIITSLDEDNKETNVDTENKQGRTTPVGETDGQWQQPSSHHEWGPFPPPPSYGYPSWTSATASGHHWHSDQASRHQWHNQSSHVPQGYHRSQHGHGMSSGPTPNQQWHYSHHSGVSAPYGSYGAFAGKDLYNAFYGPQHKQAYSFGQRPQQRVHSTSFASSRDTMFQNYESQQQPSYAFYQGPQQGVNPTPFASARDAKFGNDQEYLRFGVGNMNMAGTANTTFDMPGSSGTKPMTSEMPMPGPSWLNNPGVSSTPMPITMASPAGNKESLDDLLIKAIKPIVKLAIANLMRRSNRAGGVVLNPTPIAIILAEKDNDNQALSPEIGELALQVVGEETKTQKKQREKAELVGIEHISFSDDLPDTLIQSINEFTSKWTGTYKYTLLERLDGWRLERKQRVNSRYDSVFPISCRGIKIYTEGRIPRQKVELHKDADVHISPDHQIHSYNHSLHLDLNANPCEVAMEEDFQLNVAQPLQSSNTVLYSNSFHFYLLHNLM